MILLVKKEHDGDPGRAKDWKASLLEPAYPKPVFIISTLSMLVNGEDVSDSTKLTHKQADPLNLRVSHFVFHVKPSKQSLVAL